ncbi:unnamed protein product [Choristocarpus tenellus]
MTARLSTIKVDEDTTFRKVRREIELKEERGMMRRTSLFQEVIFTMISSPNPHKYGKEDMYKYRFGFFKEDSSSDVPSLVALEDEAEDAKVLDYCRNAVCQDLIIIPATQVSPSGRCSSTPEGKEISYPDTSCS